MLLNCQLKPSRRGLVSSSKGHFGVRGRRRRLDEAQGRLGECGCVGLCECVRDNECVGVGVDLCYVILWLCVDVFV